MAYRTLDGALIAKTARQLANRIGDRFSEAGLRHVSEELCTIAEEAIARIEHMRRPNHTLKAGMAFIIVVALVLIGWGAAEAKVRDDIHGGINASAFIQMVESIIGTIVFIGAAVVFLWTVERRIKRREALRALEELRSVAHIVDMHQLTKDPERSLDRHPDRPHDADTPHSPERRRFTPFELGRYLDYCSETCSLVGKVAALHGANVDDPVVLAAVDQIEVLTTGLSRKIWQKIMILDRLSGGSTSAA